MQTGRIIRIREYQELRVGDRFDSSRSMIPRTALAMLRDIQSAHGHQKLFAISDRTVTMRQYVGTIGLGSFAIEVLPKIDRNDSRTRERLIDMLAVGRDANWASSGIARQSRRSMTLLDCLAVIYIRRLADQWRRGHIAHYTRRSENRRCLKGKLLVAENIRHNLLHRERFYTSHSEFIEDVPICQVLKAALRVCADRAWSQTVRSEARVLLPEMDEVSNWNPTATDQYRNGPSNRTICSRA